MLDGSFPPSLAARPNKNAILVLEVRTFTLWQRHKSLSPRHDHPSTQNKKAILLLQVLTFALRGNGAPMSQLKCIKRISSKAFLPAFHFRTQSSHQRRGLLPFVTTVEDDISRRHDKLASQEMETTALDQDEKTEVMSLFPDKGLEYARPNFTSLLDALGEENIQPILLSRSVFPLTRSRFQQARLAKAYVIRTLCGRPSHTPQSRSEKPWPCCVHKQKLVKEESPPKRSSSSSSSSRPSFSSGFGCCSPSTASASSSTNSNTTRSQRVRAGRLYSVEKRFGVNSKPPWIPKDVPMAICLYDTAFKCPCKFLIQILEQASVHPAVQLTDYGASVCQPSVFKLLKSLPCSLSGCW
ncbi:hypothetical protein TRIATDRAFT_90240 [Trichoderma atroviride IMI 206040]|uniref:Uncharacterized protein n=1 Tax=Hypocrea atroviridis (strain ATCC 20476 / IMI 206040) TaxID=452589 RepID=G9NNW9_HYPAI|nr:uncharacterized protein TRIATDRAFT_90240 [Trichoderma atroviride IMI 206040]EHK47756.1 hypothetical protein TRIATDRAFT_90240 [Trichoderma atroviride IMI 206040]